MIALTNQQLAGAAAVVGILMLATALVALYIGYRWGHKNGYYFARRRFRPDAMRWREHDEIVCADREAFVRFTHTMREMTEAGGH